MLFSFLYYLVIDMKRPLVDIIWCICLCMLFKFLCSFILIIYRYNFNSSQQFRWFLYKSLVLYITNFSSIPFKTGFSIYIIVLSKFRVWLFCSWLYRIIFIFIQTGPVLYSIVYLNVLCYGLLVLNCSLRSLLL